MALAGPSPRHAFLPRAGLSGLPALGRKGGCAGYCGGLVVGLFFSFLFFLHFSFISSLWVSFFEQLIWVMTLGKPIGEPGAH